MRQFKVAVLAAVFLALLMEPKAFSQEQWLQYRWARDNPDSESRTSHNLEIIHEAPEELILPEFKTRDPIFVKWVTPMTQRGYIWAAFDRKRVNGPYDLLYIDSDNGNDLTRNEPISVYQMDSWQVLFEPAKVTLETDDGPTAYHIKFNVYGSMRNQTRVSVSSACWYEGTVTAGEREVFCILVDRNANGTFNDASIDRWGHDGLVLGSQDQPMRAFGKYYEFEGKYYSIEAARDGAYIIIEEATEMSFGNIEPAADVTELVVFGENGMFFVDLQDGAGQVPCGSYRLMRWSIERQDEDGNDWRLVAENYRNQGDFEITGDDAAKLEIGEPLKASLSFSEREQMYHFSQGYDSKYGENITIEINGRRTEPPKMAITNEAKTYEGLYSFAYG